MTAVLGYTCLLISEVQELLENLTLRHHGMPAHPRHPGLESLHAHLDKFLFKAT